MLNPIDSFFGEVNDPRTGVNIRYPLNEILFVAVISMLCGGRTYVDMADTGRAKLDFLRRFYPFERGVPREDTFRYVFMLLDPKKFGDCFAQWMKHLHGHVEGLIAIDGKACRRSFKDSRSSPLTIVNAYCHARGVVMASIDTPSKANEITVLPELLRLLNIKGCLITLDAMGCQKKIVSQIIDQEGDYLVVLKGNQGNLHTDVIEFFDAHEATSPDFKEPDFRADVYEYEEKSHGRHYRRRIVVTDDFCGGLLPYREDWKGLRSVMRIESWRTEKGREPTYEKRYGITSRAPDAKALAMSQRGHWSVENLAHWMLDVYFGEDASRVREGHAQKNLATLRRLCLNIVQEAQRAQEKRVSVPRLLRRCAMTNEHLLEVLEQGMPVYANAPSNP